MSESKHLKEPPRELIDRAEAIFEALALHYGATRMAAHWNGLDADRAKMYWAGKLDGVSSSAVRYSLKNLPVMPPTIDEFLAISRRAPQDGALKNLLAAPITPKDVAMQRLEEIRQKFPKFRHIVKGIEQCD